MAKAAAGSEKLVDIKESDDNSIVFQQDRIKDILDIIKSRPDNLSLRNFPPSADLPEA